MIIDLESAEPLPVRRSSVCIAGAGAAGICLAIELEKSGFTVTLLEGGGLQQEKATQDLYASEVSGVRHDGIHDGRFRVLGGSTTRWAGQILEFDPQNFVPRPWVSPTSWPFSKEALTPYYQRALELEGLTAAISDDNAVWKSIRCMPPDFGEALVPFFSRWCPEPNFALLYRKKLKESQNITVCLHANVCEIVLEEGRESIAGLRCRTLDGRDALFTADHYVFCLGGIESPRLLLQPLANGRVAPWNAEGLVGRYFQDHIDATLVEIKPADTRKFYQCFDHVYKSSFKYRPSLKLSFREQQRLECLAASTTFIFRSEEAESYDQFLLAAKNVYRGNVGGGNLARAAGYLPHAGHLLRKASRYVFHNRGYNPGDAQILLFFHCEQSPDSDSRIELSAQRDALGLFRSRIRWAISEQEIHTIKQFTRIISEAFRREHFAEVIVNPAVEAGGAELINQLVDSYHHMGATRMADSPTRGVVDPNLRLFGIDNGYVCSSSVFPTSGFSNPTHTIIALAARLAEHLAKNAGVASVPNVANVDKITASQ